MQVLTIDKESGKQVWKDESTFLTLLEKQGDYYYPDDDNESSATIRYKFLEEIKSADDLPGAKLGVFEGNDGKNDTSVVGIQG
jgi:hypothetical protein